MLFHPLRRSPGFAAAIILTLGLGVGANTAIFSVVNAFVLRPLPVRDGDRLVVIATENASDTTLHATSLPDLEDYRAATTAFFEDIAGYSVGFLGIASEDRPPQRVLVTWVTGNYFEMLDLRPALGRLLRPDEGQPGGADAVVVLGHATWQRRFGGDRSVIGASVRVNGRPCTIVGVAPSGFHGTFAFSESELYVPLNWQGDSGLENRRFRNLHAIARLRPGVTIETAQATMSVLAERLSRSHPETNAGMRIRVLPERLARPEEDQYRTNATGAAIVLAMVGLVMAVAAVNVTNLLLAHGVVRRRELAIRAALGAGRGRLIRQLVSETLVLAALGGAVGVLFGAWAAGALAAVRLPGDLPVRFDFQPDARVLAYAAAVALGGGIAAGVLHAWRATAGDLDGALRQAGHGRTAGGGRRIRGLLVIAQIASCFFLLVASGLFVRSLFAAERSDLGFRPDGVLNLHMDVGQLGYAEPEGRRLFDEIERRVRTLPGVQGLSFAFTVPLGYIRVNERLEAAGRPADGERAVSAGKNMVGPGYFETMGVPVVLGRGFVDADDQRSGRVAIVNQRLADLLWAGANPIGRRFRQHAAAGAWMEVVGVVATGKYEFLFEDPKPYFYVPLAQQYTALRVLHVRTSMAAEALRPAVEQAIRASEPDLPLYDVHSMEEALGSGLGFFPVRVGAVAISALGLLAFALALVGLYGVISHLAAQRTHEIGVRVAIGASRRDIVRLVFGEGLRLVVVGLGAGLLTVLLASGLLGRFLFQVSPRDPLTLATVAPLLACVALIACVIPAARAARVDPTVALRSE